MDKKIRCAKCKEYKDYIHYHKNPINKTGRDVNCKPCKSEHERLHGLTPKGLLTKQWQQHRYNSKLRGHNPPRYTKQELGDWMFNHNDWDKLWNSYVDSGYDTYMKPSIDRVDSSKGYSMDNIQLVTWRENLNNHLREIRVSVIQYDLDMNYITKHKSITHAYKATGVSTGSITKCCNGEVKKPRKFKWSYASDI